MGDARATGGATGEVLDLVRRWAAAEQDNDATAVAPLLADGFVGVGPVGFVLDRERWLSRFDNGLTNRSLTVAQPQAHAHGGSAVVVGVLEQQTEFSGTDNSGRFRISIAGVATDQGWQVASLHIGPLVPAADLPPTTTDT